MDPQSQIVITLLIVEDHPLTLCAMRRLLSTAFAPVRILAAESAEETLDLCANDRPDVVVMDISLPGMDGIEATRRIKAQLPDTQVVMHSSHDLQIYRESSAAAGACAFVAKSRTFTDLVPAVAAAIGVPPATDAGAS